MIGFNGGLVGKSKTSVAAQSNPGMWTPNEQSILRAVSGSWPTAPVPGDPFPAAYRTLIDDFASTKYYVDAVTGSDLSAGTSPTTAFATINKAITTAPTGSMIIVYPGTYTNLVVQDANAAFVLWDGNKNLQIVCAAGQVKITNGALTTTSRDLAACLTVAGTNVYGAIIERNNGGRTINYTHAFLRFAKGSMYNCVLRETNANGRFNLIYDNNNGFWRLDRCLVLGNTWTGNYSGGSTAEFINSASNNASTSIAGNTTNTFAGITVNSDFSLASFNYGVYSGTYAWALTTFTHP